MRFSSRQTPIDAQIICAQMPGRVAHGHGIAFLKVGSVVWSNIYRMQYIAIRTIDANLESTKEKKKTLSIWATFTEVLAEDFFRNWL